LHKEHPVILHGLGTQTDEYVKLLSIVVFKEYPVAHVIHNVISFFTHTLHADESHVCIHFPELNL